MQKYVKMDKKEAFMLGQSELKKIVDVGIALTAEKDENALQDKILETAMEVAHCDAGTLYLYEDDKLIFKIMKTLSRDISMGGDGKPIDLPPIPMTEAHVGAYSAIHRELINVEDVYNDDRFDFYGPKHYDTLTGYRTKSMLVLPMESKEGKLVGVLQLMNAISNDGRTVAFSEDDEYAIRTLGSQAAVSITNMLYVKEIKAQLYSFVEAFSTLVDARTPYNASHTMKVTAYAGEIADEINRLHDEGKCLEYFDDRRKEQLLLSASLHDIGKLAVPLHIMNKATRLESNIDEIKKRFTLFEAYYEIDQLKGIISIDEYKLEKIFLEESFALIEKLNTMAYITDAQIEQVQKIAHHSYHRAGGDSIPYLTDYELECLCIRKGTLTEDERKQMENHVVMTRRILEKVRFNDNYSKVIEYASSHHELIDGSGYPSQIKGDELELETRILAIVDIYDALTSKDRPYKKPVPKEKAIEILDDMVKEGKLDGKIVGYFKNIL